MSATSRFVFSGKELFTINPKIGGGLGCVLSKMYNFYAGFGCINLYYLVVPLDLEDKRKSVISHSKTPFQYTLIGLFQPFTKACFSRTMQQLNLSTKRWSSLSVRSNHNNSCSLCSDLSQRRQYSTSFCSRTGALPSRPTKDRRRLLDFILQILELIYCTNCLAPLVQLKYIPPLANSNKYPVPFVC